MYDRARDVEALSRVVAQYCLYMAGREAHEQRGRPTVPTSSSSSLQQTGSNGLVRARVEPFSLQQLEQRLRATKCRLRLIACRRIEGMPDELVFQYPRRTQPCKYYVTLCVEGDEPAVHEMIAQGCADESENLQRLLDTGFLVRRSTAAAMAETSVIDTLTAIPAHVQLDRDCALIGDKVPEAWQPEHCAGCRRVASPPVQLYALQCCGSTPRYSCSKDCWRTHVAAVHSTADRDQPPSSNHVEDDDEDDE